MTRSQEKSCDETWAWYDAMPRCQFNPSAPIPGTATHSSSSHLEHPYMFNSRVTEEVWHENDEATRDEIYLLAQVEAMGQMLYLGSCCS